MIFNSEDFLIFMTVFFILYWLPVKNALKMQNFLLLLGSYFFYAWWDWRFIGLLIGCSIVNYFFGIAIYQTTNPKRKDFLLSIGLLLGIGGLLFFKYLNFLIYSFIGIFRFFKLSQTVHALDILLPLGISFYTFRTISYLLDIHKGKIKPCYDWVIFFSYVSFFPSVISGPIDRASHLVPQLQKKREFNYELAVDGMRQILWGLFKKMVIADNLAKNVNYIFENFQNLPGSSLIIGAIFFTFQLYADFSGYSDMAIGISKLIGVNIIKNFDYPLFSTNIAMFWRKWHISLTSWLTDYLFTPLIIAFRNYGKIGLTLVILINFTIIGIWHGANWTFIMFGFLHGCFYIPLIINGTLNKKNKVPKKMLITYFIEAWKMTSTFLLVTLTFIIFRSANVGQAIYYFGKVFSASLFDFPFLRFKLNAIVSITFVLVMLLTEGLQRGRLHGLDIGFINKPVLRWAIYYSLICIIIYFGATSSNQFIYFKF